MASKSASKSNLTPKDTVVLHCIPRGKTIPSLSPFVLKLETFLKMAKIPYEIDTKKPFGPSGKTPWITLNGTNLTDSQLIIEYLSKKFGQDSWGSANEEEKALARTIRVMLEEHFFWGVVQWRFIDGIHTIPDIMDISGLKFRAMKFLFPGRIKKTLVAQGLGRHTLETIIQMTGDDLRNLSTLLGSKKFILGEEPCEVDCAVFGCLAQCLWGSPGSPYEKLVSEELPSLKEYCLRMRERYWQDWDDCLFKK